MSFLNILQSIKPSLQQKHLDKLKQTPFWTFFDACNRGLITKKEHRKSDQQIHQILSLYDTRTHKFKIGGRFEAIEVEDVAQMFGLPSHGKEVQIDNYGCTRCDSSFVKRYFSEDIRVTKKEAENALTKALQADRTDDVVRLIVILMLTIIFFANSGYTLAWNLVSPIENIKKMKSFAWARAIRDFLRNNLRNSPQGSSVSGCVIMILVRNYIFLFFINIILQYVDMIVTISLFIVSSQYWFCEKTRVIKPIEGRENMSPTIVKWDLLKLIAALRKTKLADIKVKISILIKL